MVAKKKAIQPSLEEVINKALTKSMPRLVDDIITDQDEVWEALSKGISDHVEKAVKSAPVQKMISDKVMQAVGSITDADIKKLVMTKLLR